ncbi:hypothetical protein E2562_021374 [Oryza meyeriana var. granulata]|uniref:Uncharacterized protein n=1 Tax=Oryza meyeriana var. granulata TaxID=110450 RepID=A0A6G1CHR9_9ORYZ|nr:hypothetical protein E2562_021374 [Oryza meyeriana var. granulata]
MDSQYPRADECPTHLDSGNLRVARYDRRLKGKLAMRDIGCTTELFALANKAARWAEAYKDPVEKCLEAGAECLEVFLAFLEDHHGALHPLGKIELLVMFGTPKNFWTEMVTFNIATFKIS